MTTTNTTAWKAHTLHAREQLQTGLLDLIDCGRPEADRIVLRTAEKDELTETRNATAAPVTPRPIGRSRTITDPTWREVVEWADDVASALVDLQRVVDTWAEATDRIADARRLTGPTDDHGRRAAAPLPGPITETTTGRWLADVGPGPARRAVVARLNWIEWAIAFIDRTLNAESDVDRLQHLDTVAHTLRAQLERTARRHTSWDGRGPTRCANPWGELNHPTPPGQAVCDDCAVRYPCPDPLVRGCRRVVDAADARLNASACGACRKAASRRGISLRQTG